MAKTKYTPEMTQEMIATYTAAEDAAGRDNALKALSDKFHLSIAEIRGKLTFEKVYIAKAKKRTKNRVEKSAIVANIEKLLGMDPKEGKSLASATVPVLNAIQNALVELDEYRFEEQEEEGGFDTVDEEGES